MTEPAAGMEETAPQPRKRSFRQVWRVRILAALLVLVTAASGFIWWIDSDSGHRFVAERIARLEPQSGLRISVGRIDGSLFKKAVLRDVRLSDPKGEFLSAPQVTLDWWPLAWLSNRLDIDDLDIPQARLRKLPKFRPSKTEKPLLPDFDIRLMRFSVGRLQIDPAVAGRAELMALSGDADIRSGRAIVDISVRAMHGDDRLILSLDSRPDDNRFDIDVTLNAPRGGVFSSLTGLKQDANVRLKGDGDWKSWRGSLVGMLDQKPVAGFALTAREGRYGISGAIEAAALARHGALTRLVGNTLQIDADGRFDQRLLSGRADIHSDAMTAKVTGGVDWRRNAFDNLLINLRLVHPDRLLRNAKGQNVLGRVRLDGPFSGSRFEYLLTADHFGIGKTVLRDLRAKGEGRSDNQQGIALIPVDISARRVEGLGDVAGAIFGNIRITGTLRKQARLVTSSPMQVRSDKLSAELLARLDLETSRYELGLAGDIPGLMIPGLGVVDVRASMKAMPGSNGKFALNGLAEAKMRRLDIAFLHTLAGGLPTVRTGFALANEGRLLFSGMDLKSPHLSLRGEGERLANAEVRLNGAGRHQKYGALRLSLSGHIEKPKIDLLLARPFEPAGLDQVKAVLEPDATGYGLTAQGGSTLGPFTLMGGILLPKGGQAVIAIGGLDVGGASGKGELRPVTGGLAGRLDVSGSVSGYVALAPVDGDQQVQAELTARNANFEGPLAIALSHGTLDATLLLRPKGTVINATARIRGLRVGQLRINQIAANANLVDGSGKLRASMIGQRGRLFNLQAEAEISPDRWVINGGGTLDTQPIKLKSLAYIERGEAGWRLQPVTIVYRGGSATLSGLAGGADKELDLSLARMPLSVLDLSNKDLGLGGVATGKVRYREEQGHAPTGGLQLQVTGLTRSGVTRTSMPLDVGVNAMLDTDRLAVRAVAANGGKVIGKAQALFHPLGQGSLYDRIRNAQALAQVRYAGPAEALWRLSGVEIIDLSGPISVEANVRGTLAQPVIAGAVATSDATVLSPVTGMRLTRVRAGGRFDGSQLVLGKMSGETRDGGKVTGKGRFDFSSAQGVGIDLALEAKGAELMNRDDLGATVSGPITIRSSGNGGTIAGEFDVIRSRFTLGRAAAVAQIPQLKIIDRRAGRDDFDAPVTARPWTLDIKARANNRLMVDGLGLNSEWSMDLAIGGDVVSPAISGDADLVRGTYDFAGRRFDLTEGRLRFDGRTPINPTLDITAEATVSDLSATIRVTGTSMNPIISFSSVPALPEDEVLSRILFGSSITQLSAPEALQLAAAVASLQGKGGGLDPINAVRRMAGLDRLRILPADTATGQRTSVAVGKYVTRRTYVELVTDGQGYSATRIEYQVTRWLSLLGSVSTIGRQSATIRISKDY